MQGTRDVYWQIVPEPASRLQDVWENVEVPSGASVEDVIAKVAADARVPQDADMRLLVNDAFKNIRSLASLPAGQLKVKIIHLQPGSQKRVAETSEEEPDLKRIRGDQSMAELLDRKYLAHWQTARADTTGHGREPADLRCTNSPLQESFELGRWHSYAGVIWFVAKICNTYYRENARDFRFGKSLSLMSLIGMPGSGKTTLLLELCHEVYGLLINERDAMLILIKAALGGNCQQEAESLVETLLRSLQPGRQLVVWFRMDLVPKLLEQEKTASRALIFWYLYGCLTYLDTRPQQSPFGTYEKFLQDMDPAMRDSLTASDVLRFLERACNVDPSHRRVVFVLVDELNACEGNFKGDKADGPHFGQQLVAEHIHMCEDQEIQDRPCLPVLLAGTSRVADAKMRITSAGKAATGVIPLGLLSEADTGRVLPIMAQRASKTCGQPELTCTFHPPWEQRKGVCWTLLRLSGGNFRCLNFLLTFALGNSPQDWTADALRQLLVNDKLPMGRTPTKWLQEVHSNIGLCGMRGKLKEFDGVQRLQMVRQAIAHVLMAEPIKLHEVVPCTDVRWSDLLEEGLIHAVYAPQGRMKPALFCEQAAASAPATPSAPELTAAATAAAAANSPATPQHAQTMQSAEELNSPGAEPDFSPSKPFSLPSANGPMTLADPSNNPADVFVIAQMAPVMLMHMADVLDPEFNKLALEGIQLLGGCDAW